MLFFRPRTRANRDEDFSDDDFFANLPNLGVSSTPINLNSTVSLIESSPSPTIPRSVTPRNNSRVSNDVNKAKKSFMEKIQDLCDQSFPGKYMKHWFLSRAGKIPWSVSISQYKWNCIFTNLLKVSHSYQLTISDCLVYGDSLSANHTLEPSGNTSINEQSEEALQKAKSERAKIAKDHAELLKKYKNLQKMHFEWNPECLKAEIQSLALTLKVK